MISVFVYFRVVLAYCLEVMTSDMHAERERDIRCMKKPPTSSQCGTFIHYLKQAEEERTVKLDRQAYKDWVDGVRQRWKSLSLEERTRTLNQVRADHCSKQSPDEPMPVRTCGPGIYKTVVSEYGDNHSPVKACYVDAAIRRALQISTDSRAPGFTAFAAHFRQPFVESAWVEDKGDIKADETFEYTLPCPLAHPGICAQRDAHYMPAIFTAAKRCRAYLLPRRRGSPYDLWSIHPDGTPGEVVYFTLSHSRHSNPRICILALADSSEAGVFTLRETASLDVHWVMDIILGGECFLRAGNTNIILCCCALVVDNTLFFPGGHQFLIDMQTRDESFAQPVILYPPDGKAKLRRD